MLGLLGTVMSRKHPMRLTYLRSNGDPLTPKRVMSIASPGETKHYETTEAHDMTKVLKSYVKPPFCFFYIKQRGGSIEGA